MYASVSEHSIPSDGTLPVNAEVIELALNRLWDQTISAKHADSVPVKLALATILIVADAHAREEAEQLAGELAIIEPSRIITIFLGDAGSEYSASVRTACSRRQDDGTIICWELIDILASQLHVKLLPGAVRSLIPSSVPVITIDLREYQGLPELECVLQEESNFYLIKARVVPAMPKAVSYLTFDWYLTHAVRELMSKVFSEWALASNGLRQIEISDHESLSEAGHLVMGWIVARGELAGGAITSHGSSVTVRLFDRPIEVIRYSPVSSNEPLIRLTAANLTASLWHDDRSSGQNGQFHAPNATAKILTEMQHFRSFRGLDMGHYLIRATKNHEEFRDFQMSQAALKRYQLSA